MKSILRTLYVAFFMLWLSTNINGSVRVVNQGIMGCESGCDRVAVGAPFPFFYDGFVSSPEGSVSVGMALIGEDEIIVKNLILSYLFWMGIYWLLLIIYNTIKQRISIGKS